MVIRKLLLANLDNMRKNQLRFRNLQNPVICESLEDASVAKNKPVLTYMGLFDCKMIKHHAFSQMQLKGHKKAVDQSFGDFSQQIS